MSWRGREGLNVDAGDGFVHSGSLGRAYTQGIGHVRGADTGLLRWDFEMRADRWNVVHGCTNTISERSCGAAPVASLVSVCRSDRQTITVYSSSCCAARRV